VFFHLQVVVSTTHCNKAGQPKIVASCSLPLTGRAVVDLIITELAVFKVHRGKGLELIEHAPGISVEYIRERTNAPFDVSPSLREMLQ
jgi:3-oxoacid CoA-transferase